MTIEAAKFLMEQVSDSIYVGGVQITLEGNKITADFRQDNIALAFYDILRSAGHDIRCSGARIQ